MDLMQWVALAVFFVTILVVISNVVDNAVAAMVGATVMVWIGIMSEIDAFQYVDWNVMAILVSIWVIAGYFGKTGVPSWLALQALRLSGGRPGVLVMLLSILSGVISMFVDNVVTILMMAPVALPLARALASGDSGDPDRFSANHRFRTAIGDLPPQMLQRFGVEFFDFIWHEDGVFVPDPDVDVRDHAVRDVRTFRSHKRMTVDISRWESRHIPNPLFATIVVAWFLLTVVGMAFRQVLGVGKLHR
jgi:Na+/H+ antiporter NhaD/arsenite permease-like protein